MRKCLPGTHLRPLTQLYSQAGACGTALCPYRADDEYIAVLRTVLLCNTWTEYKCDSYTIKSSNQYVQAFVATCL